MKPFPGFPQRMHYTPLPNLFFSQVLPQIDDLTELKVTLHFFWTLYGKRGYQKFITYNQLLGDRTLMKGLGDGEQPNIFTLYEENIGMLTPMIAEELRDAEQLYSASWIEDAFREAVSRNKRNWKYIEAILKRWASEGREHGTPGRDSEEDPDKYIKGKYGHIVKR
jgi:DnaD/phage-associated family protein